MPIDDDDSFRAMNNVKPPVAKVVDEDSIKATNAAAVSQTNVAKPFTQPMTISGQVTTSKNLKDMTQAEIDAITAAQIAAGGKSNDQSLTIKGETNSQRNARLTAGYKNMLAKPVLSDEQKNAGMTVKFVRTEAGGVGSYAAIAPLGYKGDRTVKKWTKGIIPVNSPYVSGTTLGVYSKGDGTYTKIDGKSPLSLAGSSTSKNSKKEGTGLNIGQSTDTWYELDNIVRTAKDANEAITKIAEVVKGMKNLPAGWSYSDALNAALMQTAVIAKTRSAGDTTQSATSTQLVGMLGTLGQDFKIREAMDKALANSPDLWKYKAGESFQKDGYTYFVTEPGAKSLSPEQYKKFLEVSKATEGRVQVVNPISGASMQVDPGSGRIWHAGKGPVSIKTYNGQVIEEIYPETSTEKSFKINADGSVTYLTNTTKSTGNTIVENVDVDSMTNGYDDGIDMTNLDPATQNYIKSLQTQLAGYTSTGQLPTTQQDLAKREAAGKIMQDRFNKYGLGSLGNKIMELAMMGASDATITLELEGTQEYQLRFAANQDRIKKGLQVLSPAEYLANEDAYRQTLRAYGLNQFDNDSYVRQFIANDVSPQELSTRVSIAVQRIQNADPTVVKTLRDFYGIGTSDMLGYVLDPNQALPKIQQQVAAAEIGSAARLQGLEAGVSVAEQLARQGVTQAEAQKGYATIADILPTADKLSQIYGSVLESYTQPEAEQEVFNSLASAQRKRKALSARETATFSGSSGASRGALGSQNTGTF